MLKRAKFGGLVALLYFAGNIPDVSLACADELAGPPKHRLVLDDADLEHHARELLEQDDFGGQRALKELFDAARKARVDSIFIALEFYPNDKCEVPDAVVGDSVTAFIVALGQSPLSTNMPQARLIVARTGVGKMFYYHFGWVCVDTSGDMVAGTRGNAKGGT